MKRITIKEAADFMGYVKVRGLWYDCFYVHMWDCYGDEDFGKPLYIGDGDYADHKPLTGKQVVQEYKEYIEKFPEDAKND